MKKAKIVELDILRAFAIMAVLVIHVSSNINLEVPWGSMTYPFYLMINKLSSYAVPLFILISGLVLFYQYHDNWSPRQTWSFYAKRIKYILIPYLIWAVFYFLFYQTLRQSEPILDLPKLLKQLPWGLTGYHLYFMVVIMQFYFVFPILMTVLSKIKLKPWHLIGFGIVVQTVYYGIHYGYNPIPHVDALLPKYIIAFCVGGAIGMRYDTFKQHASKLWWVFGAALSLGFIYVIMLIAANSGSDYWPPLYTIVVHAYAVIMGVSLVWISGKLMVRNGRLAAWLTAFGSASFGIYLIHPAILSSWRRIYSTDPTEPIYHLYQALTMLIVVVIPWALTYVLKKTKLSTLLFGKS